MEANVGSKIIQHVYKPTLAHALNKVWLTVLYVNCNVLVMVSVCMVPQS